MTIDLTGKDPIKAERELDRIIGTQDYSVRYANSRGHLEIVLALQGWEGKLGLEVLWRSFKLLRMVVRGKWLAPWTLAKPGPEPK